MASVTKRSVQYQLNKMISVPDIHRLLRHCVGQHRRHDIHDQRNAHDDDDSRDEGYGSKTWCGLKAP